MPVDYYNQLQQSADALFQLGLSVIPAMEKPILRDDYTGQTEFDEWRDSDCPGWEDPRQFGFQGLEIAGNWNSDQSVFYGLFPIRIGDDGATQIRSRYPSLDAAGVERQIKLAREYQLPLTIAAAPDTITSINKPQLSLPNVIIYADSDDLRELNGYDAPRVETDGQCTWAYGCVDLKDESFKRYLGSQNKKLFKLNGSQSPVGEIRCNFIRPCYPSIVFGKQIQLISPGESYKLVLLSTAIQSGIDLDLDFDDDLYDEDGCDLFEDDELEDQSLGQDEDLDAGWSCDPDLDEELFEDAVRRYENSLKINKSIIRHTVPKNKACDSIDAKEVIDQADDMCDESDSGSPNSAWFEKLFPPDLANALRTLTRNLPYDEVTVSLVYLTCISSLLKLGTKIDGNPLTKYEVPPNLYTAIVGPSGAKKTPLKTLMLDHPATPILLELAQQNSRELQKWEDDNRGVKRDDKSPKPVPLTIRSQDYSPEALVAALQKADERGVSFGIFRDELNGLFKSMNQYVKAGQGAGEEQLLELFDGKPFESLRVSTPRSYQRCSVSIYGNLQPSVFREITKNPDATGQWGRFLFAPLPQKTVPLPVECTDAEQQEVNDATKILEKYALQAFQLQPEVYSLDYEARCVFSSYEYEKQQGVHSTANESKSALHGKSAGKVLRIAGIIYILSILYRAQPDSLSIGSDVVERAIALVDYSDHWVLTQYTSRESTPQSRIPQLTRRLHELAFKKGGAVPWSTLKDCLSSAEAKQLNRMKAEEAFRYLEALGYGKVSFGSRGGLCYTALKPLPAE